MTDLGAVRLEPGVVHDPPGIRALLRVWPQHSAEQVPALGRHAFEFERERRSAGAGGQRVQVWQLLCQHVVQQHAARPDVCRHAIMLTARKHLPYWAALAASSKQRRLEQGHLKHHMKGSSHIAVLTRSLCCWSHALARPFRYTT